MDRPLIKLGSMEPAVRELKVLLNHALKPSPGLSAGNVNFGFNTLEAVKRFQRDAHLKVDGLVGPDTWKALLGRASPVVQQQARLASAGRVPPAPGRKTEKAISFTDGVEDPHHRDPSGAELPHLKAHERKAHQYMAKAQRLLLSMERQPVAWSTFAGSFLGTMTIFGSSGKHTTLTPLDLQRAKRAAGNYGTMLGKIDEGGITYKVFDHQPKTADGKEVYAYTGYDKRGQGVYIAFSKQLHLDSVEAVQIDTFIHEMAHYAWHAGHAYGTKSSHGIVDSTDWETALKGADRYAGYAATVWSQG